MPRSLEPRNTRKSHGGVKRLAGPGAVRGAVLALLISSGVGWILSAGLGTKTSVVVVSLPGIGAYQDVIQAIQEQMPDVEVLDARQEQAVRARLAAQPASLAIAVGGDAAGLLDRIGPPLLPTLKSVLMEADLDRPAGQRSSGPSITVEMDPAALLAQLRRLFPDRTRLGVLRGPMQSAEYVKSVEQSARRFGFTLEVRSCADAREVVKVFLEFQSSDFVWCPANPQLYNSATLKPLLIASLTRRMPVIGFSPQFVEAGALFGGAADYRDVGRQTAEVALRLLRHEPVPARIEARSFRFAYNQRVARLLGVKATGAERAAELDVIR